MIDLPPEVCFRSAGTLCGEIGYQLQYQIHQILVNVVFIASSDYFDSQEKEEDLMLWKLEEAMAILEREDGVDVDFFLRTDKMDLELEEWAAKICKPAFLEIANALQPVENTSPITLYQYLHPKIINLQLETIDGQVSVIRYNDAPPWPTDVNLGHPGLEKLKLPEKRELPIYLSRNVNLVKDDTSWKVLVDGNILHCKLNKCALMTEREHDVHLKLAAANLQHLRIPALRGYVKEKADEEVIALLYENIDTKYPTLHEAIGEPEFTLDNTEQKLPSLERRRKWAQQIEEIVRQLHANEIVWGDVKPANVLIDMNDDAWVLDLEGGFTLPWKDGRNLESKEVDWKAVQLLVHYLETGEAPSLPDEVQKAPMDIFGDEDTNNESCKGQTKEEVAFGSAVAMKEELSRKRKRSSTPESKSSDPPKEQMLHIEDP